MSLQISKSSAEVPIIVADASDWEGNFKVARSARVVVTLAGPFAKIGQKLIDACAHSGTHYADITGETGWVRQNVHRLSGKAEETGAVLASLCGHDSVPWEFTAKALEAKLKEVRGKSHMNDPYLQVTNPQTHREPFLTPKHSLRSSLIQ